MIFAFLIIGILCATVSLTVAVVGLTPLSSKFLEYNGYGLLLFAAIGLVVSAYMIMKSVGVI